MIIKYGGYDGDEDNNYRSSFTVEVNGKQVISVRDDEPEDSNLCRSFSGVYNIPALLNMVITAMKNGEEVLIDGGSENE